MTVHNLSKKNSILNQFVEELRNVEVQNDRERFRKNLERIGNVLAYELSKVLDYAPSKTQTPLGEAQADQIIDVPVIATILRAGLPLQAGINQFFNHADLAYISAFRRYTNEDDFEVIVEYMACPPLAGRVLIIADPMLATGRSLELCYNEFMKLGNPKAVHLVSAIGSDPGVKYVQETIKDATLWIAAIDKDLDQHGYIVPGLGDAGDLSFGEKMPQ